MAKYSTGGGSDDTGGSCELCGATDASLQTVNIAGAQLQVCASCAQHRDDAKGTSSGGAPDDEPSREKRAAQNAARIHDAQQADASHWEEGADYDDDQLPYLVTDYGRRVTEARQDAGLQREELADELGLDESELLAVEQGRATQAGIGGSVITALEDRLDVELADT
ncbi:helix-turn-helix domain-containing protein [Halapricum desulfuricans]|uniref:Putative transcription factor n=1 Tax=Halapricum desulfuricans TaxID=2841257 RepID=A0A897NAR5_9EURY|nr:multiprotein-bridging factor 1 family protein [Halapricum desulfuricans]QSG09544.1 putative transcription factor [Halapricum desulfuricans]QSG11396.1 putative transcription factor [Halapricum desulfuricans]